MNRFVTRARHFLPRLWLLGGGRRDRHGDRGGVHSLIEEAARPSGRGQVDHIIILDGTMASLRAGELSNAGLLYQLLAGGGVQRGRTLYYQEGIRWHGWRRIRDVAEGRGIDEQISRAYGHLASHYREGDRIWLFGYSRGAFAVRSLAGLIDRLGLLRQSSATERNIRQIWRHYRNDPYGTAAQAFARRHCHLETPIEMVGVWDTVKALGLRLPLIWLFSDHQHDFHSDHLGASIRHGCHALALDETRAAFAPVLWECPPGWEDCIEQVWFRGSHSDVGGQIDDYETARPLANISLVWMLDRAEAHGLLLPQGWRALYPCRPDAPMYGTWRGWGKWFLFRRRRAVGQDNSERFHESVAPDLRAQAKLKSKPKSKSKPKASAQG